MVSAMGRPYRRPVRLQAVGFPAGEVGEAGVVREHLDDRLDHADALLQPLDLELLVPERQADHQARLAGAGGAPGAVQVGLVVGGRVVVDDDVDVVDVDAAGGDVGGDQHLAACRSAKSASAFSRWPWRRSPWMAAAWTPSSLRARREPVGAALGVGERRASRPLLRAMAAATFTLSISWTARKRWFISSTVTVVGRDLVEHGIVLVALDRARRRRRRAWPRTAASGAGRRCGAGSTRPGAGSPCRPCGRPRRRPRSRGRRAPPPCAR